MYQQALERSVELLVFPELAVSGYPPEDLLHKKYFLEDCRRVLEKLASDCKKITTVVGCPLSDNGNIFNSAAVLQNGSISSVYHKAQLPNYGVFDEQRYFQPGSCPLILKTSGLNIAVTVCRDIWDIEWLSEFFADSGKIDLLANISASPFYAGKQGDREQIVIASARKIGCAVGYCNLVGGQDELIFDGRSMFADSEGRIAGIAQGFVEDLFIADVVPGDGSVKVRLLSPSVPISDEPLEEIYQALVLGTRDYARKNGFQKVLLGLSGGIDSSLSAAIAAAALGAENVTGITMPSRFNSPETINDAKKVADNLGIKFLTVPIEPILKEFDKELRAVKGWDNQGIAYENLQARIRGTILMSLSNQLGALVLTSGNKSETAVGYTTLYGDTAGGFAVIKDVMKTVVYSLAEYVNMTNGRQIIPEAVINRAPTAELRPGQKDTDTLPEYDLLDKILSGYVEEDKSAQELIESGLPADTVRRVITMVDQNEYKRRQSPPGIKITQRAFGKDWRLPITNRYKDMS